MSVKERLIEYLKHEKISQKKFADAVGLSGGYVNAIRNSIQPATLNRIAMQYPTLNTGWLLTGEGSMLKNNDGFIPEYNAIAISPSELSITIAPLIGQYAQAGYLSGYADPEYLEKQPMYYAIKKYSGGNYVAFEIRGDSMDDNSRQAICSGDVVLGRELYKDYWLCKLHIPKVFLIVHKEDGILLKEIIDHDVESGIITCHSYNPDKDRYPDFLLHLKDIQQLFYMKELRRGND